MLHSRDHWLRHIVPNMGSAELRPALQSAMRQIIADELEIVRRCFRRNSLQRRSPWRISQREILPARIPDSDLVHCAGLTELPGAGFETPRAMAGPCRIVSHQRWRSPQEARREHRISSETGMQGGKGAMPGAGTSCGVSLPHCTTFACCRRWSSAIRNGKS